MRLRRHVHHQHDNMQPAFSLSTLLLIVMLLLILRNVRAKIACIRKRGAKQPAMFEAVNYARHKPCNRHRFTFANAVAAASPPIFSHHDPHRNYAHRRRWRQRVFKSYIMNYVRGRPYQLPDLPFVRQTTRQTPSVRFHSYITTDYARIPEQPAFG